MLYTLSLQGTDANAVLKLTNGWKTALQVVVDGIPQKTVFVTKGRTIYSLAAGLLSGEHTIEIWKRPEGYLGELQFCELQLNKKAENITNQAGKNCA